jgi:hypothetical protein
VSVLSCRARFPLAFLFGIMHAQVTCRKTHAWYFAATPQQAAQDSVDAMRSGDPSSSKATRRRSQRKPARARHILLAHRHTVPVTCTRSAASSPPPSAHRRADGTSGGSCGCRVPRATGGAPRRAGGCCGGLDLENTLKVEKACRRRGLDRPVSVFSSPKQSTDSAPIYPRALARSTR